jgi:hypothetical protein
MSYDGVTNISKKRNLLFPKIKGEYSEKDPDNSIGKPMVESIEGIPLYSGMIGNRNTILFYDLLKFMLNMLCEMLIIDIDV